MFGRALSIVQLREIERRLVAGEPVFGLIIDWQVSEKTIYSARKRIEQRLTRRGVTLSAPVELPKARRVKRVPCAKRARVQELIEAGELSNRAICREVGVRLDGVNTMRREHEAAILAAGGTLPLCGCGQPKFHPRWCAESARKGYEAATASGVMIGKPFAAKLSPEARQDVINCLVAGDRPSDIAKAAGVDRSSIRGYLPKLTPEQVLQRAANIERRAAEAKAPNVVRLPRPLAGSAASTSQESKHVQPAKLCA